MARIETWFDQDLKNPVPVRVLTGSAFSLDNLGNLIGVKVTDGGEIITLAGSVTGYCMLADGQTVTVAGTRSGNMASIVLPQTAYTVPGPIRISIKLTEGSAITTLLACVGTVVRTQTGNIVNPGSVVQDWSTQISAQLQACQDAADNMGAMVAVAFNPSSVYAAGNYVTYNGGLYRITAAHEAGTTWANTSKTQVTVGAELSDLNRAFNNAETAFFTTDKTPAEYQNGGISANGAVNSNANRVRSKGIMSFDAGTAYADINTGTLKINLIEYTSATTADTSTFNKSVSGGYVTGNIRFVPVDGYGYRLSVGNTQDTAIDNTDAALASIKVIEIIPANAKDAEYLQKFEQLEGDITGLTDADAIANAKISALNNTSANKLMMSAENMYDISTSQEGYTVRSDNGKVVEQSGYTASAFIPVRPNTPYSFFRRHVVAWYKADGTFISGVGSADTSTTLTSPEDAALVRFSHKTQYVNVQMSEGYIAPTAADDVVPYSDHIRNDLIGNVIKSKNLYNIDTSLKGFSVRADNGLLTAVASKTASDFIPVKPNTPYSFNNRFTLAWYDENKEFISGVGSADTTVTITSPIKAKYLRFSHENNYIRVTCNEGKSVIPWQPYDMALLPELMGEASRYEMRYSTLTLPEGLSDVGNLCLYGYKLIYAGDGNERPKYQAFLFIDDRTNKFYIADTALTTFAYAFDWDASLVSGESVHSYMATITADGDVIFFRMWQRQNPILYPHGDYNNPVVIDFGSSVKPYGFLTSISCVQFADGSFVFGEYAKHSATDEQNNDRRNIWRVTKPYTNTANWTKAHSFKHVYYNNPVSDEPDNEIGHIHTVVYDFYSGRLICSTGDIDRHCRVWKSDDKGITWSELVSNGQKWRSLGMVFTADCSYWATDSFTSAHILYKANRVNGQIDFSTAARVTHLEPTPARDVGSSGESYATQASYGLLLCRNPYGLLILDRAEPRPDGVLEIPFWSLDDEKLYTVATLGQSYTATIDGYTETYRNGLCNQVITEYQPDALDCVLTGGGRKIRPNTTDILNNSESNYIGVLKIRIMPKIALS